MIVSPSHCTNAGRANILGGKAGCLTFLNVWASITGASPSPSRASILEICLKIDHFQAFVSTLPAIWRTSCGVCLRRVVETSKRCLNGVAGPLAGLLMCSYFRKNIHHTLEEMTQCSEPNLFSCHTNQSAREPYCTFCAFYISLLLTFGCICLPGQILQDF